MVTFSEIENKSNLMDPLEFSTWEHSGLKVSSIYYLCKPHVVMLGLMLMLPRSTALAVLVSADQYDSFISMFYAENRKVR